MTNFYAELNIPKTTSLDEIQEILAKLRNVWENRQNSASEKATKMLALLIDAENVFKNEASRRQYDSELESAGRKPEKADFNTERNVNFNKWFAEANSYLNSQEYDLAKSAIDKALQYRNPNNENAYLYSQAAEIYRLNSDYRSALNFINESLVIDKTNPTSFLMKCMIFEALDTNYNSDRQNFSVEKRKPLLETALRYLKANKDNSLIGITLGLLAYSWYFLGVRDSQKAEEYARESLKYDPTDINARSVIDDIERIRVQNEAQIRQRLKAEEEKLNHVLQNKPKEPIKESISSFHSFAFWEDITAADNSLYTNWKILRYIVLIAFTSLWAVSLFNSNLILLEWRNPLLLILGLIVICLFGYWLFSDDAIDTTAWRGIKAFTIVILGILSLFGFSLPFQIALPIYYLIGVISGYKAAAEATAYNQNEYRNKHNQYVNELASWEQNRITAEKSCADLRSELGKLE